MAEEVMVDPITMGVAVCQRLPTTEILAMLMDPAFVAVPPGFRDMRISLMADQLEAVAELICSGIRTNFHPLKSMRLAPPPAKVESNVIAVGVGTFGLGRGVG